MRALLLAPFLLLATPAAADLAGGANHITPSLVAESMTPAAGGRISLAFAMSPAPDWHGYWRNPGDAGMNTLVKWQAPAGLRFGPLAYPVPGTLLIAGLMNYVYEGPHALLVTLDVPSGLAKGTRLPIAARLDWLACSPSTCVPETANLTIALTVGDGAIDPTTRARFAGWRAALPHEPAIAATFQQASGRVRIGVPLPAATPVVAPYFFPATEKAIDYAAPQIATRDGDRLVIETKAGAVAPKRLEGVLRLSAGRGIAITADTAPVPPAAAGAEAPMPQTPTGTGPVLALALGLGIVIIGGVALIARRLIQRRREGD